MRVFARWLAVALTAALVLGLVVLPAVERAAAVQPMRGWTKYAGLPTMPGAGLVGDVTVINDGGTYRMWYTHVTFDVGMLDVINGLIALTPDLNSLLQDFLNGNYDALWDNVGALDANELDALLDAVTTDIGYATSTNGTSWTVQNANAISGGSGLRTAVGMPTVINDGGTYKMWYTKVDTDSDLDAAGLGVILTGLTGDTAARKAAVLDVLDSVRTTIGYATSADGDTWVRVSENVDVEGGGWDLLESVGAPSVILDGGTYKMWYTRLETDVTDQDIADAAFDFANYDIATLIGLADGAAAVIGYATSPDGEGWTVQNDLVLPAVGLWAGVGDPSVIRLSASSYEMWYTRSRSSLIESTLRSLWGEVSAFDWNALWTSLKNLDLGQFFSDLLAIDLANTKTLLANTGTDIGYARSSDGVTWTVLDPDDLRGATLAPWSSVAAPSVVYANGSYKMWFTEGIDDLTVGELLGAVLGSDLHIGYARPTPPAPPPPPEEEPCVEGPGVTCGTADEDGVFQEEVTAPSEDQLAEVTVPQGTTALTAEGEPVTELTVEPMEMETVPPPPEDHEVVGVTYTFGPEGATFDAPVAITIHYSDDDIPAGVREEDLTLAVWDPVAGRWDELDSVVDTVNNTVTGGVTHFSTFTILAEIPPPVEVVPVILPAAFQISQLTVAPAEVGPGDTVTISVLVENIGDVSGTLHLEFEIDGEVVASKQVTIDGRSDITVPLEVSREGAGEYTVSVSGLTGTFTVVVIEEPPPSPPSPVEESKADIQLSHLTITPARVQAGEEVTIGIVVANEGEEEGSYTVVLKIGGDFVDSEEISLAPGDSETVTFTVSKDAVGVYSVAIGRFISTFAVDEVTEPLEISWGVIGAIVGGVVVLGIVLSLIMVRRRSYY